jgi:hypothetical protein
MSVDFAWTPCLWILHGHLVCGFCMDTLSVEYCGNTDSNFFALDPKTVPKLGNLRFGNSKTGKTG